MNRKGFTLVELLAVIILLSILSSIAIFLVGDVIKTSREKLTDTQIKNIEEAAKSYYLEEGINDEVYTLDNTKSCVNLSYLIDKGYINDDKIRLLVDNKEINGSVNIIYKANQYSYEYNEDVCKNVMPNVIKTILNDNPLQEEIEGMFNYTNEGRQTTNGEINTKFVTNGLYSTEDDDGTSYYFRGNVNNLIQFGEYNEDYYACVNNGIEYIVDEDNTCSIGTKTLKFSKDTPIYFRIVRITGDNTLRLIYNDKISNSDYAGTNYSSVSSVGYISENQVSSNVKNVVDKWYKLVFKNTIYDKYIVEGKFCNDVTGLTSTGSDYTPYAADSRYQNGTPTLKCPIDNQNFGGILNLKAGLITLDELMYAGYKSTVSTNNYLSNYNSSVFTMTASNGALNSMKWVFSYNKNISTTGVGTFWANVVPVINVDVTDLTISGSGSVDDPYVLTPKQN